MIKQKFNTKRIIILAMLVALASILDNWPSINSTFIQISFNFIPIVISGMLFGPAATAIVAALSDILGVMIRGQVPNMAFTVIAAGIGACYGFFLSKTGSSRQTVLLCQLLVTVIGHIILNTVGIYIFYNKGAFGSLPLRIVKNVMFYPIEVMVITQMLKYRTSFERFVK